MSKRHNKGTVEVLCNSAKCRQCKHTGVSLVSPTWSQIPIEVLTAIIELELLLPAELISIMKVCSHWKFVVETSRVWTFWKEVVSSNTDFKESLPFIMLFCLQQKEEYVKRWAYDIACIVNSHGEHLGHYVSGAIAHEPWLTVFYSKQNDRIATQTMSLHQWTKHVNIIFKELILQFDLDDNMFPLYYSPEKLHSHSDFEIAVKMGCTSVVTYLLNHEIVRNNKGYCIGSAIKYGCIDLANYIFANVPKPDEGISTYPTYATLFWNALCSPEPSVAVD